MDGELQPYDTVLPIPEINISLKLTPRISNYQRTENAGENAALS